LAEAWRAESATADPVRRTVLAIWADWAERVAPAAANAGPIQSRVAVLVWSGIPIIALPGEIFAETALEVRRAIGGPCFVLAYCNDNPGYVPPEGEFRHGGYEVDEAHRFYGMPAAFAPGSAERLARAAVELAARALGQPSGPLDV
jgi:hypothetical protein